MKSIGTYEAKTKFSELIARVHDSGEPVLITNHGQPIAILSAAPAPNRPTIDLPHLVNQWRIARKGVNLGGLKVRDLINEGRR